MKAVEAENLRFSYDEREVLRGVSLRIETGEFVAVLGPNGAGKSTLVKCIAGILECGGVEVFGKPIGEYSRNELARILAYVPQRTEPGFMTVFDTVLLGRRPYMGLRPSRRDIEAVERALKRLGIWDLTPRRTRGLSGGELQKVNIARALAQEPRVLIMDEPTNNLDVKSQLEVMQLAKELSREGKTVITVMHDVNLALRFARRFIFMKDGKIIADGGFNVLSEELFREVYGVNVAMGEVRGVPTVVPLLDTQI
ncbi:ABC transporter ATP-binding protein [Thermococcus sp. MV11]|uniref:ABC transporter ATP-binding protein n=1 Tax=Thermococcus sp. MV11 TaxID=1638267 RepID=UPI00142F57B7|nr:ABC transporter ATP-binding protein [Thermococcus sp. MV11]NJE04044.1 ABC transporter ATP-binding protein [Thermococcus sp. MV11]